MQDNIVECAHIMNINDKKELLCTICGKQDALQAFLGTEKYWDRRKGNTLTVTITEIDMLYQGPKNVLPIVWQENQDPKKWR